MLANLRLDSFVDSKSWLLFNRLNANGTWFQKDIDEWDADEEYVRVKDYLRDLKVVNDLPERCIKYIQEFVDLAKDSHYQEDILIVAKNNWGIFKDLR